MDAKCPICGNGFEASSLSGHLLRDHSASTDPEIKEAKLVATHPCPFCGTELPTPEELKTHIAGAHRK